MSMKAALAAVSFAVGAAIFATALPAGAGFSEGGEGWIDDRPYYVNQPPVMYVMPARVYAIVPQPPVTYGVGPYVPPVDVYGGGRCGWLYRNARDTGSSVWWDIYRGEC
jgi:hypothetical protein